MQQALPTLLILCCVVVAAAQSARPSRLFDVNTLLKDLQTLSSDDMQGRQVDTPGGEKARTFIVDRFKASDILPVNDSYTKPFTYTPQPPRGQGARTATPVHGINVTNQIIGNRSPQQYTVVSAHYNHL